MVLGASDSVRLRGPCLIVSLAEAACGDTDRPRGDSFLRPKEALAMLCCCPQVSVVVARGCLLLPFSTKRNSQRVPSTSRHGTPVCGTLTFPNLSVHHHF